MWSDVVEKIMECVLSSFYNQSSAIQEEVKKLDGQRMLPGFNYCNFFTVKVIYFHSLLLCVLSCHDNYFCLLDSFESIHEFNENCSFSLS